jgi:hypothetical protein
MMVFNEGNGVGAGTKGSDSLLALAVVVGKGEARNIGICIDLIDEKGFVPMADLLRKGWYRL